MIENITEIWECHSGLRISQRSENITEIWECHSHLRMSQPPENVTLVTSTWLVMAAACIWCHTDTRQIHLRRSCRHSRQLCAHCQAGFCQSGPHWWTVAWYCLHVGVGLSAWQGGLVIKRRRGAEVVIRRFNGGVWITSILKTEMCLISIQLGAYLSIVREWMSEWVNEWVSDCLFDQTISSHVQLSYRRSEDSSKSVDRYH